MGGLSRLQKNENQEAIDAIGVEATKMTGNSGLSSRD